MFRVASYNMRKAIGTDRRRRPERTLEVLGQLDADVVALQEADRRFGARVSAIPPDMIEAESDYKPVDYDTRIESIGFHGNAMLVRKSVEILDQDLIPLPSLEPRGAILADLGIRGQKLRVVGMHLDLSGLWRRRQAHAILSHLHDRGGDMPTVMMGDLNEWSLDGGCLRDFGAHHVFVDSGLSFHARRPVAQLDRIIVTPDLQILAAGTLDTPLARRASDHLPVWADLKPDPEAARAPRPRPEPLIPLRDRLRRLGGLRRRLG